MENRFGVKDFFLFLLLGAVIVLIVLAMFQYDRQWQVLQQTQEQVNNLTGDITRIRQRLAEGVLTTQASTNQPNPLWTGLERVVKSYSHPDYAEGDTLVWVALAAPSTLTPIIFQDITAQQITAIVQDSLLGMDPNTYEPTPGLASSYHISADQLTIDYTLKQGITFSDGSPFSADDVVFTFEFAKNPKVEAPWEQSLLDKIQSVEKIDDYHVRFHFSEPYFMSLQTSSGLPIMSKAFYSKYSVDEFNKSTGLLIGTGPYRMPDPTSWKPEPGKPIELLRNERYWGPRPSFNKIVIRVIENVTARATAYENGEIDAFAGSDSGPYPDQYMHMLSDPALEARSYHYHLDTPLEGVYFVAWNQKQGRDGPPSHFADRRVRKALTMLIDRDEMVRQIMNGYASVAHGPFHPLLDQADPNLKPLPYDPDAAIKLLAEAGFVKKGDVMYEPNGQPFVIKMMYPTSSDIRKRAIPLMHDSFAQAGIDVQTDAQEFTVFEKRCNDREYDAAVAAWGGAVPDDLYQIFDSVHMAGVGDDYIQYQNKELDATIEKARTTLDHDERTALWRKCDDIIYEDQPYSFLWINQEMDLIDKRFKGVEPTKLGVNPFQEWYTPAAMQKYSQQDFPAMVTYIFRRILLTIPTILGITLLVFFCLALSPGGIGGALVNSQRKLDSVDSRVVIEYYNKRYGIDKPPIVQYVRWLNLVSPFGRELKEDGTLGKWEFKEPSLGDSLWRHRPVVDILEESLPLTLLLNLISIPIVYTFGVLSGITSARRRGQWFDTAMGASQLATWSVPTIWAGVMMIGFLASRQYLHLFPPAGLHETEALDMPFMPHFTAHGWERGWLLDVAWHLVLPVICLSYGGSAFLTKLTRGSILENLSSDYVRTARAKGLSENIVLYRHVFRNSLLALITIAASILPALLSGSVIVESIFSIPGMGKLGVEAVTNRDRELTLAVTLIGGLIGVFSQILRDVLYAMADPRVAYE